MKEQPQPTWQHISTFGKGNIYALGDERKIVTEGLPDFKYKVKEVEIKEEHGNNKPTQKI